MLVTYRMCILSYFHSCNASANVGFFSFDWGEDLAVEQSEMQSGEEQEWRWRYHFFLESGCVGLRVTTLVVVLRKERTVGGLLTQSVK